MGTNFRFLLSLALLGFCLLLPQPGQTAVHEPACFTLDGVAVNYLPFHSDDFSSPVARTDYFYNGPQIIYNATLFEAVGEIAREIFYRHECAHHELGHTMLTFELRRGREVPMKYQTAEFQRAGEDDADCEAGYRLRTSHPETTVAEIEEALIDVYRKREDVWISRVSEMSSAEQRRAATVAGCFEGRIARPSCVDRYTDQFDCRH